MDALTRPHGVTGSLQMSSRSGLAVQGGSSETFENRKYCCLVETTFESAGLFAGTSKVFSRLCLPLPKQLRQFLNTIKKNHRGEAGSRYNLPVRTPTLRQLTSPRTTEIFDPSGRPHSSPDPGLDQPAAFLHIAGALHPLAERAEEVPPQRRHRQQDQRPAAVECMGGF